MAELTLHEYLEIVESLLEMSARKEAEVAELKAQLDVFKPKDVNLSMLDDKADIGGKVMLVFQSKTLREILKTMLEKNCSYDVKMVDTSDDIESAFALYQPDICVIEHGGYNDTITTVETIRQLRRLSHNTGLIAVLPENDVDVIREIVTAGVDDFLVKPIDTRRMNNVIGDIILKRSTRKAG